MAFSSDDWDRIQELAVEVVNLSAAEEYEASDGATRELVDLLDDLQERYGPLPSLLATRADYVDTPAEREFWLLAAYREAERRGDTRNQTCIAHSLAAHYVEGVANDAEGIRWLATLEERLCAFSDEYEAEEVARLRDILLGRQR